MVEIKDKKTKKIIAVGEIIIDEKDYIKIHSSNKKYMKKQIIIQHVLMAILIIFTTIVSYGQTKITSNTLILESKLDSLEIKLYHFTKLQAIYNYKGKIEVLTTDFDYYIINVIEKNKKIEVYFLKKSDLPFKENLEIDKQIDFQKEEILNYKMEQMQELNKY